MGYASSSGPAPQYDPSQQGSFSGKGGAYNTPQYSDPNQQAMMSGGQDASQQAGFSAKGANGGNYGAPDYSQAAQQQMSGAPTGKGGAFNAPNYNQMAGFAGGGQNFSNSYSGGVQFDPRSQWAQSQGYQGYGPTAPPTYEQATQWGGNYGGGGYGGGSGALGSGYGGQQPPWMQQPPPGAWQQPQGPPGPVAPPNPGAVTPTPGAPASAAPAQPPMVNIPGSPPITQATADARAQQVQPTAANQAFGAVPSSAAFTGMNDQDKAYLYQMSNQYRQDLRGQPGAHQLYQDMFGGTKTPDQINALINDTSYNNPTLQGAGGAANFDINSYNGPMKAQYEAMVKQHGGTVNPYGTYTGAGLAPANANSQKQQQLAQAAELRRVASLKPK